MTQTMTAAYVNALSEQAATDHGRPVVTYGGMRLIDVRNDFPTVQVGRTMAPRDPALLQFVSQHHDAAFYPDDPLPGDDFDAEMQRMDTVWRLHRFTNGWGGIGYHTYGFPSGRLYLVGSYETQRASVANRNHLTIGHCSAGLFMGKTLPPLGTQLVAAMASIAAWTYARRMLAVISHHDAADAQNPTVCCGDTRDQWVPRIPQTIIAIAQKLNP
ncbi:MAG: hypothetical protein IVW53_14615 [Chloroflexi bacterium]|nr:hypothetical protein [Chloroflexota bacterium]